MSAIESFAKNEELRKRIFLTIALIAIFRLGVHIPTPGVDGSAVLEYFRSQQDGFFGVFNIFSGGALERYSIFALGIMPYISASIIFLLLTPVVPQLEALKKEGEPGRKKINQYTRYTAAGLAFFQAFGINTFLSNEQSPSGAPLILDGTIGLVPFEVINVFTLTAGTCFVMWLAEQITERGIGNGSSLIITAGIVALLPSKITQLFTLISNGEVNGLKALFILALTLISIAYVVFVEAAQRRIPIHASQKAMNPNTQVQLGPQNFLPIKVNISNVMPPIFANSLLVFPSFISTQLDIPILSGLGDFLSPTSTLFNVFYVSLIVFFCFFWVQNIGFNPAETAENLKKQGKFIPGIRAGKSTADYIGKVANRITVTGAIYLCIICVVPGLLNNYLSVNFLYEGTSILIMVGTSIETATQIQTHQLNQRYNALMRGNKKVRTRRVRY